jgi:hypothetical protein
VILDSELMTLCIATWRRSDGRGIRAIRSPMLSGMDSVSCAADSQGPTSALPPWSPCLTLIPARNHLGFPDPSRSLPIALSSAPFVSVPLHIT